MKPTHRAALPLLLLACLLCAGISPARAAEPYAPPAGPITGYVTEEKVLFLTFDDGPFAPWTEQVLDVLAKHDARATFFILGRQAAEDPAILQTIYDAGHGLGNHSYTHANLSGVSQQFFDAEVGDTAALLGDLDSGCLRPPYGAVDSNTLPYADEQGYTVVKWNMDPRDWAQPGAGAIATHVIRHAQPGSIVVLHDGGGDRSQTVAALDILIPRLKRQGYSFQALCRDVTPDQLVTASLGLPAATAAPVAIDPLTPAPTPTERPAEETGPPQRRTLRSAAEKTLTPAATPTATPAVPPTPTPIYGAISFPHSGSTVRGPVLVQGSADHPAFEKWQLDLLPESGDAIFLAMGESRLRTTNKLAVWDTRLYPNGPAMLRLRVVHGGNYEEYFTHLTIAN